MGDNEMQNDETTLRALMFIIIINIDSPGTTTVAARNLIKSARVNRTQGTVGYNEAALWQVLQI